MSHKQLILSFAAFVVATIGAAALAFMLGQGAAPAARESLAVPPKDRAAFVNITENVWSCDQFRGFPGLRANHRERVCGPGGPGWLGEPAKHAGRRGGPLSQAVIARIAGAGPRREASLSVPGSPTGAHAAPESVFDQPTAAAGGLIASATGASWSAPGGRFSGQPSTLLAGLNDIGETPPDEPPPPEVTPIPLPGALPLMATAIAGLFAAGARRRRERA